MQIIFQDPYASLDPRVPIGESIIEGLHIHKIGTKYYNFGPFQLEQTNSAAHSNPQYPDPSGLVAGCIENLGNEMGKAFYEYNDSYMVPFWSDEESDPM
jgi:ABC-type dipeptide/oligopeptide/nickel transport system ATPase component